MFEKLLSLIPYNPSMLHQLAFYGKRMRQESSIRRTGLIFIVLAFLIQFFAVLSPPQSTVAASTNDLVNGGFNSAAQAAADCSQNVEGYGTILANYGITCATVAAANTLTISATDFNRSLYSMGRLPYGIAGETPVNIAGGTFFVRYLWGWGDATYRALNVTSPGGQTFLLLYACGNLTSVGLPVPVPPIAKPPLLTISKTSSPNWPVAGSTVAPGTVLSWRVVFNNLGGSAAKNVLLTDPEPANTTFNWVGSGAAATYSYSSTLHATQWTYPSVSAGTTNDYVDVGYKVNADTPSGTQICNVASVSSTQTGPVTSNKVCFTIKTSPPPPQLTCKYDTSIPATSSKCAPCKYDSSIGVTNSKCAPCQYDSTLSATSPSCVPCQYNNTILASNSECKSCSASIGSQDTIACVSVHKTAANLTQGISNANNTTAQASDSILYTLYAQNNGKATVKKYIFTEDLSDVLDYANVSDLYGGKINQNGQVTWPAININAGATVSVKLSVKVKDPIPQTPTSSSDPEHFNLIMTNVYGNTINIKLPSTPAKVIETTAAVLPNTGPGTSIFIGAAVMIFAGYFFARSRLLAKETTIAIQDNISEGL